MLWLGGTGHQSSYSAVTTTGHQLMFGLLDASLLSFLAENRFFLVQSVSTSWNWSSIPLVVRGRRTLSSLTIQRQKSISSHFLLLLEPPYRDFILMHILWQLIFWKRCLFSIQQRGSVSLKRFNTLSWPLSTILTVTPQLWFQLILTLTRIWGKRW